VGSNPTLSATMPRTMPSRTDISPIRGRSACIDSVENVGVFIFRASKPRSIRQIGNAVPVPLAQAFCAGALF
jgi:site-specific DNA-cytosine methylase